MLTEVGNNPRLVWLPYPNGTVSSYKIYRGLPSLIKPNLFFFNLIATVNNNVFEYIDHDIMLNPNGDEVRYYIKAVVNGSETEASNTVSTHGGLYKGVTPPPQKHSLTGFSLEKNYPNPFNPSTKISYTLPKTSFVTLKVYNSLGKEVAVLVKGRESQGRHSVNFNANGLPSGVYIYRITAGKYNAAKKTLLLK